MTRFSIPEMSCGHCVATIEQAVTALDPAARVSCDLESRSASIETTAADAAVIEALDAVGFDATAP